MYTFLTESGTLYAVEGSTIIRHPHKHSPSANFPPSEDLRRDGEAVQLLSEPDIILGQPAIITMVGVSTTEGVPTIRVTTPVVEIRRDRYDD